MFTRQTTVSMFYNLSKMNLRKNLQRNIQVSIIGASNDIGSNLAVLLKQNNKIGKLHLHGDDEKVKGIALELNLLPGGPMATGFVGDNHLSTAIIASDLVVMVSRIPRKPGAVRSTMLETNAPFIHKLCKAVAERNPGAFLAISTNPVNSLVPFASSILYKYNSYNPFRVLGITHIDTARSKSYAATALRVNPRHLQIPVVGGHSENTVVPLFSNLSPSFYSLDSYQADMLTRLVRKAGSEVLTKKQGTDTSVTAMAWSINEFVEGLVDAIGGSEAEINCYAANPCYGTKYLSAPTKVGPYGVIQSKIDYQMSNLECSLLSSAVSAINKDIMAGEEHAKIYD